MLGPTATISSWREVHPPPSAARVYYSYKIMVSPGIGGTRAIPVGTFQNFAPRSTRQVQRNRGICNNGGIPHELVPGPADMSITVQYLSLYARSLVAAFGFLKMGASLEQNLMSMPFDVFEQCHWPVDADRTSEWGGDPLKKLHEVLEQVVYKGCIFSDLGRTLATGTIHVIETATIQAHFSYASHPRAIEASDDATWVDRAKDPWESTSPTYPRTTVPPVIGV